MKNIKYLNQRQLICYRRRVARDSYEYGTSKTARMYGISRSGIYEWRNNPIPKKPGPKGKVFWRTSKEIEKEIIKIRKATNYGPKRLKHEMRLIGLEVGEKAIRGVLYRNNLVKHHKKKRIRKQQRFYAPYPGYRIQLDTKTVPDEGFDLRTKESRYQFTAIDIATKIRFCLIYKELSNGNSIDFLFKALGFYQEIGIRVECIQTDNHATFTNFYTGGNKKEEHEMLKIHPFTKACIKRGVEHKLSSPGTPRHNCFVERSHRTDEEEFYRLFDLRSLDDQKLSLELNKWMFNYNFNRIHSSCSNKPPMKYYLESVWTTGA